MKKNIIKSVCISEQPTVVKRKSIMLGRQIRQGLVDGISDDCSQLLRNCYDKEHGVLDPYYSFGNETIGVDKFQRAVISARQKQNLEDATKTSTTTEPVSTPPATPVVPPTE